MVPSKAVFHKLFNLEEEKAFKQKKIPLDDFEDMTGKLSASMREIRLILRQQMLIWYRSDTDILGSSARRQL